MELRNVAIIVLRVLAIQFWWMAAMMMVEVPRQLVVMTTYSSRVPTFTQSVETALGMIVVRAILYVGAGIAVMLFARPLAYFLTRDLEPLAPLAVAPVAVAPPTPASPIAASPAPVPPPPSVGP